MKTPKVTLEQWLALKSVVEEGSFAKASEALNKSQSTISYAITKLEEQLPSPVLKIEGRKAVLTEEGKVLYRQASQLIDLAINIEQTAACLAKGWDTELTINIDSIVNIAPVLTAIRKFTDFAPQTRITLLETTLSGTVETILERKADLVLSGQTPPGFLGEHITNVVMVAVAHTNHPLIQQKHLLTDQDLKQHRQIVVRDSGKKRNVDSGWLGAEQRLTVSNFNQSLETIRKGLGFAFIPEHLALPFLETGELSKLQIAVKTHINIPIYLIQPQGESAGPATKKMCEILWKILDQQ